MRTYSFRGGEFFFFKTVNTKMQQLFLHRENRQLQDLYLMGNPCSEYPNYRDFVIATLPVLSTFDGAPIEKSERISATQVDLNTYFLWRTYEAGDEQPYRPRGKST